MVADADDGGGGGDVAGDVYGRGGARRSVDGAAENWVGEAVEFAKVGIDVSGLFCKSEQALSPRGQVELLRRRERDVCSEMTNICIPGWMGTPACEINGQSHRARCRLIR